MIFTERQIELLKKINIHSYEEVLNYFPYKYVEFFDSDIDASCNGKRVVIRGTIVEKSVIINIKKNLKKYTFSVNYRGDIIKVEVFNQTKLYNDLYVNGFVLVAGKYSYKRNMIKASEIIVKYANRVMIKPIYHLNNFIYEREFRSIVSLAFNDIDFSFFDEELPLEFVKKYKLIRKKDAYFHIHFPKSKIDLVNALRYFKYKELLNYCLKLCVNHNKMRKNKQNKRIIDRKNLNFILKENDIKLTNDQIKVCKEIFFDIESNKNMYRMLIGDVGCGKTIVSALTLASICNKNYQGVLLCPTEILARQHFEFFQKFLKNYRICLLVSSSLNKEIIKENIRENKYDIIIGTTSLIEDDVVFNNLGIVVIDEQHRFGVNQRKKLIEKGKNVDILYMSATPIPRSLALSIYGELDISIIKEFPNKKRDVKSYIIKTNSVLPLIDKIKKYIEKDKLIFIVCSTIEGENFKRSAESVFIDLNKEFKDDVCLIHGKLNDNEKNKIIEDFKNYKYHILVSTTVIEVGIDIKDASVMIIFNANCFGLATLHQLRGRVGRNGQKGYCYFLCDKNSNIERLKFLKDNDDGFKISEYDLSYRGPGELEGVKQSGIREFTFSNIEKDNNIFMVAYNDAQKIIKYHQNVKEYRKLVTKL